MARDNYDVQLKELKNQMLLLGSMIEETIRETIQALVSQDAEKAKEIAAGDGKTDDQVRMIEHMCFNLLLRQQPVAGDFRAVSAALKMITDMERIGDHGVDISELTILMGKQEYPKEIELLVKMSRETTIMLIEAVDSFAEEDGQKAQQVIDRDDVVDDLFLETKTSIAHSIKEGTANAEQALDLLMAAKYFERIGDHATNIAEWVLYSVTGEVPNEGNE